jgi:hypothetical protein
MDVTRDALCRAPGAAVPPFVCVIPHLVMALNSHSLFTHTQLQTRRRRAIPALAFMSSVAHPAPARNGGHPQQRVCSRALWLRMPVRAPVHCVIRFHFHRYERVDQQTRRGPEFQADTRCQERSIRAPGSASPEHTPVRRPTGRGKA